jgi:hypothetical protein
LTRLSLSGRLAKGHHLISQEVFEAFSFSTLGDSTKLEQGHS